MKRSDRTADGTSMAFHQASNSITPCSAGVPLKNPIAAGPHKDPVSQPLPGMMAMDQAERRIRAAPLEPYWRRQISSTATAIGMTIAIRTEMEGVRTDRRIPMRAQETVRLK